MEYTDVYKNGLPNLPLDHKKKQTGCYIIRNRFTKSIEYVGFSGSDLYKTIYRHFQSWKDSKQKRVVFDKSGYQVKIIFATKEKAKYLEKYLVLKLKPLQNDDKFQYFISDVEETKAEKVFKKENETYPF